MKFDTYVSKLLEDFNVFPSVKHVAGSGPNIDFRGASPTGFKGANLPGIAPNPGQPVLVTLPRKKKKKK
ncbi:MAG: hypothetical protein EBU90_02550 [Proteobacteria bacterium]|nr:hypothetical protein [Pseudomonadota bacterium]NBP13116.1 hypothetical protein [bacterium]